MPLVHRLSVVGAPRLCCAVVCFVDGCLPAARVWAVCWVWIGVVISPGWLRVVFIDGCLSDRFVDGGVCVCVCVCVLRVCFSFAGDPRRVDCDLVVRGPSICWFVGGAWALMVRGW